MTVWLIEPHDPLIFRDGRPFGPTPGAHSHTLTFPFPSTIAGGVRSQAALDRNGAFRLNPKHHKGSERNNIQQQLTQLTQKLVVRGPLLVQIPTNGQDITPNDWLVPAPNDALILVPEAKDLLDGQKETSHGLRKRLVPLILPSGGSHDLKHSKIPTEQVLSLVGMPKSNPSKPHTRAPHYWTWPTLREWLYLPNGNLSQVVELSSLGHNGPEREQRVHVGMDFRTRAGKPEALFDTAGLEFTSNVSRQGKHLSTSQPLGLAVLVEDQTANQDFPLRPGPGCLGSERRIVNWRSSTCEEPICPENLIRDIVDKKACRMLFLTPAHFSNGYLPAWSQTPRSGWSVQPQIKGIAIDRPQVVSGWDIVKGSPKKTRRLAPAGTVLFLSLTDGTGQEATEEQIRTWVQQTWMQCLSDDPQDCLDGFGLAVLGTWSGKEVPMEWETQA